MLGGRWTIGRLSTNSGQFRYATALLLGVGLHMASWAMMAQAQPAGQWPQWRGPEGAGVSTDTNLPEQWSDDSANIKWKTKIPGQGYSSPIVSGNRVFLTTAYEDYTPGILRRVAASAGCLLGAIVVATMAVRLITTGRSARRRQQDVNPAPGPALGAVVSTALALVLLVLLFAFPKQYDATLGRVLAWVFGTYDTEHVFYIGKEVAAATWLNTGAAGLLGLAAALHWLRGRFLVRLIGAVALAALAMAFVKLTPMDAWKYPVARWTRLLFTAPAALTVLWYLLGCLEIRRGGREDPSESTTHKVSFLQWLNSVSIRWRREDRGCFGGASSVILFVSMAALAVVAFVPINLILPRMGMHRAVVCLDFASGQILWQTRVFTGGAERKHRDNSYATPTPATDGRHVVAHFGIGTVCLDFDGRVLWKETDPQYVNDTRYGAAASVLVWRDRTIILQESEERTRRRTWLAAFETASGDLLWKDRPAELRQAYTTGLIHDDGGSARLIIASFHKIFCFELESGRVLWERDIPMEQIVASFARDGSILCIGGGTWGPKGLIAFRLQDPGVDPALQELWQVSTDTPECASPVIHRGILFTITDTGVMRAYDAASGTLHWRERLRGRYLASLLAGDGKVYACSTSGLTTVVAAEPSFRILARNQLQGDCRASFAVADSHFLVRTADFLYCIAAHGGS